MSGELQFLFLALWKNSSLCSIYSRDNIVFIGERILVSARMEAAGWPTDLVTIGKIKKNYENLLFAH